MAKPVWAIGLMSGTSLDGVDAALLHTDGETIKAFGPRITVPYDVEMQRRMRAVLDGTGDLLRTERDITLVHIDAIEKLLLESDVPRAEISVIGFHGQTIAHRPDEHITWQIGDASLIAARTGIDVVSDFRRRDMAEGGQGAPLVPLFHQALVKDMDLPIAVVNIGGVANVTWIGENDQLLAFDTGPGNGLLNDWIQRHTKYDYDKDGELSAKGQVREGALGEYMSHPYFEAQPPKSLDRLSFDLEPLSGLSVEDGAATLAAFTADSIAASEDYFPEAPKRYIVCGGGRLNPTLMKRLADQVGVPVEPAEAVEWHGDAIEAEAFAFLAVRAKNGLTLTRPESTGAARAVGGGAFYRA